MDLVVDQLLHKPSHILCRNNRAHPLDVEYGAALLSIVAGG